MGRIAPLETPTGKAAELLEQVHQALGAKPNLFRTLAVAPAALEGFLGLFAGLGGGQLPSRLREQIALGLAESNGCSYCLSAHTYIASNLGVSDEEIAANRDGKAGDPKVEAALRFALAVNEQRGSTTDADWSAARNAGLTDAEIVEIVGHVALNVFTNYFNKAADTGIDFSKVEAARRTA